MEMTLPEQRDYWMNEARMIGAGRDALRRQHDNLRRQLRRCAEVLDLIDFDGHRAAVIHGPQDGVVRRLCERVGYGAVIDSAARQWFLKDRDGAHTAGPCAATVRNLRRDLRRALHEKAPRKVRR